MHVIRREEGVYHTDDMYVCLDVVNNPIRMALLYATAVPDAGVAVRIDIANLRVRVRNSEAEKGRGRRKCVAL